jgi:hypothetical protein
VVGTLSVLCNRLVIDTRQEIWGHRPIFLAALAILPIGGVLYTLSDDRFWLAALITLLVFLFIVPGLELSMFSTPESVAPLRTLGAQARPTRHCHSLNPIPSLHAPTVADNQRLARQRVGLEGRKEERRFGHVL